MKKIATHRSVQASATAGVVVAAGLYLLNGNPAAWAIAALWAVFTAVAITQAAHA